MSKRKHYHGNIPAGAIVRYNGTHLRCTGQSRGAAVQWRAKVVPCACYLCGKGEHVALDEEGCTDLYSAAELEQHPHLRRRHIAKIAIAVVGKPTHLDDAPHVGKVPC